MYMLILWYCTFLCLIWFKSYDPVSKWISSQTFWFVHKHLQGYQMAKKWLRQSVSNCFTWTPIATIAPFSRYIMSTTIDLSSAPWSHIPISAFRIGNVIIGKWKLACLINNRPTIGPFYIMSTIINLSSAPWSQCPISAFPIGNVIIGKWKMAYLIICCGTDLI